ncbi:hypothetical protein [Actinoplanes flavus]|uniref:Lipoprotein n=1 Tax=Actinoplanes flavus TaxID=2820290 RepID=A0ABS3UDM5_9ACTN|nr:hypothetical protein [Actinoplanes flavus]MBO3736884.1 hypothetical protein [Actinoplanes flavus]
MNRRWALIAVVLVFLGIAGCAQSPEDREQNNAVTERMEAVLAENPDVVRTRLTYQNNITAGKSLDASVGVGKGADLAPIAEETIKVIWTSELAPLRNVTVYVWDTTDDTRHDERRLNFEDAALTAELEGKYGPRPV